MSVVFIHSAQCIWGGNYWKMQIVWCVIGFSLYGAVSVINYQLWMRYAHIFYFLVLIGLLLVFAGPTIYGARRWIDFGLFKVQPSEVAKWSTMIFGASLLARSKVGDMQDSLKGILKVAACFGLPMFLIFLQPDLGSTMVFPPIAFSLLYAARMPTKFFVSTLVVFVVLLGLLSFDLYHYYQYKLENPRPSDAVVAYEETSLLPLKDYQRKRILTFVAPEVEDPHGVGSNWNRIQALIAVATGGVSGKGLGEGMQAKLGYLPTAVAHNDFIFAVIAEESGLLGGGLAIGMLCLVVFGCLRVAYNGCGSVRCHACRWSFRPFDDSCIHQYRNDHWHYTNNWIALTIFKLWWVLYGCVLLDAWYGTECFSLPKHSLMKSFYQRCTLIG